MGPSVRESSLDMAELPDHHETRCVPNTEQERRRCRASRERPCVGELSAKRLELIKEVVPGANRVAVLCDPTVPDTAPTVNRVREAAQALGVQLRVWEIRDPSELEKAFVAMSSEVSAHFWSCLTSCSISTGNGSFSLRTITGCQLSLPFESTSRPAASCSTGQPFARCTGAPPLTWTRF